MSGNIGDRLALPPVTANPVRPGNQFEVMQLLSGTIGDAVLEEMDARDGFHRAGNPGQRTEAAAPVVQQPQQVQQTQQQPVTPATQQANPAQTPVDTQNTAQPVAPTGRKILGKYNSEEEAERGYHSLIHLNQQVMARNDELARMVADLNAKVATGPLTPNAQQASAANPQETPPAFDNVLNTLQANYNIDQADMKPLIDGLLAAAESRARVAARQELEAKEAPTRVIQQADDYLLGKYPDAAQFGTEIAQFVHGDPELQAFVEQGRQNGDLRLPMEIAWLKFNQTVLNAKERAGQVLAAVSQQEIDRTRIDAGLVSSQAGGVHTNEAASNVLTKADMDRLVGMFHAGYREPFLRATIGATLPDEVFGIER